MSHTPSHSIISRAIHVLPPGVAERIAAGEVIERPSSVVKELVENSLDAGATEVAVILEDGGKSLIEVLDNGSGMPPDDLGLCVERHATSKLSSLDDLERILTLGFRGEALASIAAVSDLEIISRSKNAPNSSTAFQWTNASQQVEPLTFGHFLGTDHGTRIRSCGLFSSIPARLKFLKSQAAELMQVREWLERLALAYPEVGFRLVNGDRTVLNLRPQTEIERVRTLLAEGENFPILTTVSENMTEDAPKNTSEVKVRAHWVQGLSVPQTRKLIQIVNRRAVRDRLIQQALLSSFKQALLPGQFPALALFLEVHPSEVDVNVHPTKTEIRFLESRKIFQAIHQQIEGLLKRNGAPAFVPARFQNFPPFGPSLQSSGTQAWKAAEPPLQKNWNFLSPDFLSAPVLNSNTQENQTQQAFSPQDPTSAPLFQSPVHPSLSRHPFQAERFVGILFSTYLLFQLDGELALIDQHAAHERVRYEKLKKSTLSNSTAPSPQALLIPEAVRFDSEARTAVEVRLPWLGRLGFEAEVFGEDTALFRAIPAEWGTRNLRTRLKNIIEKLITYEVNDSGSLPLDETLFEALASEACHSAVRAGDRLEKAEALALVEDLFRCEHPWNCPHGRPTIARVPESRMEEWFQRRV